MHPSMGLLDARIITLAYGNHTETYANNVYFIPKLPSGVFVSLTNDFPNYFYNNNISWRKSLISKDCLSISRGRSTKANDLFINVFQLILIDCNMFLWFIMNTKSTHFKQFHKISMHISNLEQISTNSN